MIKEVLDTSKIDFATERQNAEIFDLSEELPKFCEPYGLIAKTKQVSFSLNIEKPCPVFFPKKALKKFFPICFLTQFPILLLDITYG